MARKKNRVEHLVAFSKIDCWMCKAPGMTVCAPLITHDGQMEFLNNVTSMEETLRARMEELFPNYRLVSSRKTGLTYFANTCPVCGMFTGDTHLHGSRGVFGPRAEESTIQIVDTGLNSDHIIFQDYKSSFSTALAAESVYRNSTRVSVESLSGDRRVSISCASCGDPMYVMDRFLVHNQTVHVCKTCERTEALNGYVLYPGSYFRFDPEEYPEESYAPEIPPRDDVPPPEVEF
jgi:hypothetical protein